MEDVKIEWIAPKVASERLSKALGYIVTNAMVYTMIDDGRLTSTPCGAGIKRPRLLVDAASVSKMIAERLHRNTQSLSDS